MEDRSEPLPGREVSRLALLRAQRRIREMEGRSGHLCALLGCLYTAAADGDWSLALSLATFQVVALQGQGQRYGMELESRLPLSGKSSEVARSTSVPLNTEVERGLL